MTRASTWIRSLTGLSLALAIVGCSKGSGAAVAGKVTLDSKPLENAMISFEPFDKANDAGIGGDVVITDAKGEFKIDPSAKKRGLRPGKFAVWITKWVDREGKSPPAEELEMQKSAGVLKNLVPGKYSNHEETPLIFAEIKPGKNEFKWDLTN